MGKTAAKKKGKFGKILLWTVVIFIALHIITDGESTDAFMDLFGPGSSDYTSGGPADTVPAYMGIRVQDADGGALVTAVTPGGPAEAAGIQVSDLIITLGSHAITGSDDLSAALAEYQEGDSTRVIVLRGGTSRTVLVIQFGTPAQESTADSRPQGGSQTSTVPPGTTPQETIPPVTAADPLPSVPDSLRDHVYLNMRVWGHCEKMTGNVVATVIFVNDPTAVWTDAQISAVRGELEATAARIMSDAAVYGAQLQLSFQYKISTTNETIVEGDNIKWMDSALTAIGLPDRSGVNTALESAYGVDTAPVIFVANQKGRDFATSQFCTLYEDASAFYHELNHIFGAKDFYYPDDVYTLAQTHLSNTIMIDSSKGVMDDLTAYLIGWTDTLSDSAMGFLQETAYLTQEYLSEEHEKETYTGYVTDYTNRNGTYTGYLVEGVRHGQGKFTNSDGDYWEGTYVHGSLHGQGFYRSAEGVTYSGEFYYGTWHGTGTITWTDGSNYHGQFTDGKRSGQGTYTWADGAVYQGQWADGKREGTGTMRWANGNRYEGQWSDSQRHGTGTMYYHDGDVYVGQWANDKRSGQGTLTYDDGTVYTGQWADDKRSGQGTLAYANGNSYVGSWSNSTWNGQGTFTWASGGKYVGEFVDGQRHGYGIYYFPSGNRYEGQWANGERNGQGTMYYANGTSQTGIWANDKLQS